MASQQKARSGENFLLLLPGWSAIAVMYAALSVQDTACHQTDRLNQIAITCEGAVTVMIARRVYGKVLPAGCKTHEEGQIVEDSGALYSYCLLTCLRLLAVHLSKSCEHLSQHKYNFHDSHSPLPSFPFPLYILLRIALILTWSPYTIQAATGVTSVRGEGSLVA